MSVDACAQGDPHLDALGSGQWVALSKSLQSFTGLMRRGERPAIRDFLPADPTIRRAALVEMILEEIEFCATTGEPGSIEDYLERFPELSEDLVALRVLRRGLETVRIRPVRTKGLETAFSGEERLGRFAIERELGRGSCGIVYLARDERLNRVVALKVPQASLVGSYAEEERFLREARSVAALRHPNIVTVHEVDRLGDTLYLVMEYIPGKTLGEWARETRPTPRQAAGLVAMLAEALQHAHERGVIHRDIKPSNVLVNASGNPHLVDFGLAKSSAEHAGLTTDSQLLGTPTYMSPEQASGETLLIDERSDLYSLGVVLYELLAGAPPFQGTPRMVLAQVCEDEPRPIRRYAEAVPRDLETVCLKLMAKEPARRYMSASELEADLRRFLRNEPVHARPVRQWDRLLREARRRPLFAATLATLALVLFTAFIVITWQWRRQEGLRSLAEARLADFQEQHRKMLKSLVSSQQLIGTLAAPEWGLFGTYSNAEWARPLFWLDNSHEKPAKNEQLLKPHREFLEQLRAEPELREQLLRALVQEAVFLTEAGEHESAADSWKRALDVCEELLERRPRDLTILRHQVLCLVVLGEDAHHRGRREESLQHALAARDACLRIQRLLTQSLRDNPGDVSSRETLAVTLVKLAVIPETRGWTPSESLKALKESESIWERLSASQPTARHFRVGLAECRQTLGRMYLAQGRPNDASLLLRASSEILQTVVSEEPENFVIQFRAAVCLHDLAAAERASKQWNEAAEGFLRSRQLIEQLRLRHPGSALIEVYRAQCELSLGSVYRSAEVWDGAKLAFERAIPLWESLNSRDPTHLGITEARARSYFGLASVYYDRNLAAEAVANFHRVVTILEPVVSKKTIDQDLAWMLSGAYHNIGNLRNDLGHPEAALESYHSALAIREELVRTSMNDARYRSDCAGTWHGLGETLERLNRTKDAAAAFARAVEHQKIAVSRAPDEPTYHRYLVAHLQRLAKFSQ